MDLLMSCSIRPSRGSAGHLLAAAALLVLTASAGVARAAPPNIVFLLTDDLDTRSAATMPRLQELARHGTSFSAAYATTPMCVPARATLLTGKYPHNTGVRSNRLPSGGYQAFYRGGHEEDTVAVWLQRAGYRTAHVGKYLNWYPEGAAPLHVPKGWSRWVASATYASMHAKYDYRLNEDGRSVAYGDAPEDYSTDIYAAKARAFIAEAAEDGNPFALFLALPSPHTPEEPAPRHALLFADARAPRLPSFPELDTSDKPAFMRFLPLAPAEVAKIDSSYRQRLRMLRSVDEALGSIRDLLAARGLARRTYVVVSADHGWHQGEHNQMPMKGRPHEEDIRVPLIVAGPGVPAGRTIDRLVGNADLAPTFAQWAGAEPGAEVDGRSFAGLLAASDPMRVPWRRQLPIMRAIEGTEPAAHWPTYTPEAVKSEGYACLERVLPASSLRWPEWRGLRSERLTYVEHVTGDRELYYSPAGDPYQLRNVFCRAAPAFRYHLARVTAALAACRAGTCRRAEDR
jgi:arylsulfatase A-like enzyme